MQGQLIELFQLFAEPHQTAGIPAMLQSKDVPHFMYAYFGNSDVGLFATVSMAQAMD
jgi:hypothetical protein